MQTYCYTPHLVGGVTVREVHTATELADTTPEQHTAYISILLEIITSTSQKKLSVVPGMMVPE